MASFHLTIVLLVLLQIWSTSGITGYDCGAQNLKIKTVSLVDVGDCDIPDVKINTTDKYIQLLQSREYAEIMVRQCKVEVRRTISYCGALNIQRVVNKGIKSFTVKVASEVCHIAHDSNALMYLPNHNIYDLKPNGTVIHTLVVAGSLDYDGDCDGAGYTDVDGTYENVVVQEEVKISLYEHLARVKLEKDVIVLNSGTACPLSRGYCIDPAGGDTYWEKLPRDMCGDQKYIILYKGLAKKVVDDDTGNHDSLYTVETNDVTFAFSTRGEFNNCGYTLYNTEHPKLFIFETTEGGRTFAADTTPSATNLDLFAYINSKFIYVERHVRKEIKSLYMDVITQKCMLEKKTIKNSLALAMQAPDLFAYDVMQSPGYMAVLAGEVVHMIQCAPVEVSIQEGKNCFLELEVSLNNETFYLTPKTKLLKRKGTQITCNKLLATHFQVDFGWIKLLPSPTEAIPPTMLQPSKAYTWKYNNLKNLATSGIYSHKDIESLREQIMFQIEKPADLNDISRGMKGQPVLTGSMGIGNLFTDDVVDKYVTSAWVKFWHGFTDFGSVSAGFLAILLILQILRLVVDTVVHGYTLHAVYGWSVHLLAAIFGSVSHLLLHLGKQQNKEEKVELEQVIVGENGKPENREEPTQSVYPTNDLQKELFTGLFNKN